MVPIAISVEFQAGLYFREVQCSERRRWDHKWKRDLGSGMFKPEGDACAVRPSSADRFLVEPRHPIHRRSGDERPDDIRLCWSGQPRRWRLWLLGHHQLLPRRGQPAACSHHQLRLPRNVSSTRRRRVSLCLHRRMLLVRPEHVVQILDSPLRL